MIRNMKKIIFVCHGNICRSPAAEFIAKKLSDKYIFISRATSYEEIGNDIYPPMKRELIKNGIPFVRHYAQRISDEDFDSADYIFYMDEENKYSLEKRFPNSKKLLPIFNFTPCIYKIEDPWYTGRFDIVIGQIKTCVIDILKALDERII